MYHYVDIQFLPGSIGPSVVLNLLSGPRLRGSVGSSLTGPVVELKPKIGGLYSLLFKDNKFGKPKP